MFKSHVEELLRVLKCLFKDAGNAYPTLRDEFVKDHARLVGLAQQRGIHLFCVDLPAVGKHLDRCVSEGTFSVSGIPLTGRCPRCIMYPEFLKGLWGRVFSESGVLKEDCDVEALLVLRQVYYLAKGAKLRCADEDVSDEVKEFFSVDSQLPEPEGFWSEETCGKADETFQGFSRSEIYSQSPAIARCGQGQVFLRNLDLVSGLINSDLGSYDPEDWDFRHGPGVVSERKGSVNKYQFVNWSDRLESVFPLADFGFHNHNGWGRYLVSSRLRRTTVPLVESKDPASRMISVPKTLSKPRLIAAEPTEHMWCQQNLWHYFCDRVKLTWLAEFIRFRDQTLNQELCTRASVDGSLATLDLSSASDRMSCHFVGNLFRANLGLLEALRATRTRQVTQTLEPSVPEVIVLKKFSTMGSACTFPVETIGFLSIALAAVATVRGLRVTRGTLRALKGEVAVFGDDIIVPQDSRELCCTGLEALGFKLNAAKSYWSGNFRESCGVDAYRGVDITPVYWRALTGSDPESIASALAVRNSFYKRGYWTVAAHIASTIPRGFIPRVQVGTGAFGLESFLGLSVSGHFRRFNWKLQREEVYVQRLSARQEHSPIECDSALLQFFTEDPHPSEPWASGVALRPKTRLSLAWEDINELEAESLILKELP